MEVQVDFAFFDPEEIDYHAIKNFLLPFLEGQAFSAGDLADLIIKQNEYVGTVVKVEGEDETYGFVSVVNLHKHKVREHAPASTTTTAIAITTPIRVWTCRRVLSLTRGCHQRRT
jgi:hypothetical protein